MNVPTRARVLDTPVDIVDMDGALAFVDEYIRSADRPGYVVAVNPEKVFVLRETPFLRDFFKHASLLIPDGIGIVKAIRILQGKRITRVAGADLMQAICAEAVARGYRLFVYGAAEEVNRGAVEALRQRHPGIAIVGRANGYVPKDEMDALVEQINASNADILFVALGSPRQEQWIHDHLDRLSTVRICQGIGGTLDTIVGTVKRAPKAFQAVGLEWFYRLCKQPSRIGRQLRLLQFVIEVLAVRVGWRRKAPSGVSKRSISDPGFCNAFIVGGEDCSRTLADRLKDPLRPAWRLLRYAGIGLLRRLRGDWQGTVFVDPQQITHTVNVQDSTLKRNHMRHFGSVSDGDWDLNGAPLSEYGHVYSILSARLHDQTPIDDIPGFKKNLALIAQGQAPDGCRTEAQLRAKWRCIETLADQVRQHGYKSQRELRSGHPFNEIRVQIGRNGQLLFEEGLHRLVIAQVLGIDRIPVIITRHHAQWVATTGSRTYTA